jgi:methionyl-tRNA formyltransferase
MSILFAGTPANAARTLEALLDNGIDISLVLTRPDSKFGRKGTLTPSPVADLATSRGIEVLKLSEVTENSLEIFKARGISFAVVVAFGVLFRTQALSALPQGWYNLHYSLLPKWRGAAPVQRALLAGERETGVTLFKIEAGLDSGPILSSVATSVAPRENFGELLKRLTELGITVLLEQIPRITSNTAQMFEQDETGVSLAPKISRAEAKIHWLTPSRSIENLVRASTPEPGAWANIDGTPIKITDAFATMTHTLEPGAVGIIDAKVFVGTLDSDLALVRVHPSGKREMPATDWVRGLGNSLPRFDLDD